ncbi:MAG: hypothetical protein ACRDTG_32205 [Pseudonocardiaceae bacterium]
MTDTDVVTNEDQGNTGRGTAALPHQDFAAVPERRSEPLPAKRILHYDEEQSGSVVVIIALIWLIMAIKHGPDWLTPIEIATLLLSDSGRAQCPVCDRKEHQR